MTYRTTLGQAAIDRDIRLTARTRAYFPTYGTTETEDERSAAIAALPAVEWKGRTLRTIRCVATTGKGPHDLNVPEYLLWSLISMDFYHCPFHPSL